jgi:hypothetical protein
MRLTRPLVAAALAFGSLLVASPAGAATCVGEQTYLYFCASTPTIDRGSEELCVYAGGDQCQPVSVPTVGLSGEFDSGCGGRLCPQAAFCEALIENCPL